MSIFRKYIFLIILLAGCRQSVKQKVEDDMRLYPEPITMAMDTIQGYTFNPFTGDSIKPLINSFGDPVKTGVTFPFKGIINDPEKTTKAVTGKSAGVIKTNIKTNTYPVPQNLTVIPVDTTKLKRVKPGRVIAIAAVKKIMPFRQPAAVKALPLRFKDNATANVQYLDVDQGMSSSYVYALLEDKRGNIWIGTDGAGISKYDGVSFVHYHEKEGLSANFILSMMEDEQGIIWIGTTNGLNSFDGQHFTQYTEGLAGNMIYAIMQDKKKNIWISTNAGVSKYDGKQFVNYSVKQGLPCDTVTSCIEDSHSNIWIATNTGTVKFDGENFTFFTKKDGLLYDGVSAMIEDRSGNIWLSTIKGINKYDGKSITQYTQKEGLSGNIVWSMIKDRNDNIWIGTTLGGINKYDGKKFTQFNQKEGLSNNKVRSIIEDHNGNIWFGTDGGGINKLNDAGFTYLSNNEVLNNNRVRPIIKDKDQNIWFGTESAGVGKYNAANETGTPGNFNYFIKKGGATINGQRSLLADAAGNIWIGSTDGYISKFNGQSFTDYPVKPENFGNTIFDIQQDRFGNTWFAKIFDGISKLNGQEFTSYTEKEGLSAKHIFSIFEDSKGNLWFGTNGGGLSKYNGTALINYTEKEGLFSKSITSIIEDKKGNIWLGTLNAGVCKFDGNRFTYYTEKEGLSNNNVWSLIEDSTGNIWAGTNMGLNLFVPSEKKDSTGKYVIYKFGLQDGLKAVDFNLHSVCIDNNNRIWWGTGKNIVIKNLNRPFVGYNVHDLKLNEVEINDRFYDYQNLPDSINKKISFSSVVSFSNCPDNLAVTYNQDHLTFYFSAIDWSAPDKIKYSYRMAGLDEDWSRPSEEPVADYRNLSHGNYQLQVRAIGQSQVWTAPLMYDFTINPAWWQTWWFKIFIVVALLAMLFFIGRFMYYYQLRKQRAALEKQLAVQFERQRISAEMHDDIGAGLSGIRLLTEMTKNKVTDEKTAAEVEKIYQSVGDISAKMKEVIWSLNTENDNLLNLIGYVQKQAKHTMEHYPGKFSITTTGNIPDIKISGEARRHIYLAVKEALHNVIKHSGAGKVGLLITCNERLHITVTDDGKGMDTTQNNSTGNGLKNMRRRMEQLGGNLFINNKNGLALTFEIPLKTTI